MDDNRIKAIHFGRRVLQVPGSDCQVSLGAGEAQAEFTRFGYRWREEEQAGNGLRLIPHVIEPNFSHHAHEVVNGTSRTG
jgi:hypothetical protein